MAKPGSKRALREQLDSMGENVRAFADAALELGENIPVDYVGFRKFFNTKPDWLVGIDFTHQDPQKRFTRRLPDINPKYCDRNTASTLITSPVFVEAMAWTFKDVLLVQLDDVGFETTATSQISVLTSPELVAITERDLMAVQFADSMFRHTGLIV